MSKISQYIFEKEEPLHRFTELDIEKLCAINI